jgi:quercetin dioxygenase-like cupin family protein
MKIKSKTLKYSVISTALVTAMGIGYAAGQAQQGQVLGADEMQWQSAGAGSPLSVAVLWGNPGEGEHGRLLKLPAGFDAPVHAHTGDYHGINLTGTWRHYFDGGESKDLPPGSYVFQPGNQMHGDACIGDEDCILFLYQKEKADFIPKQ